MSQGQDLGLSPSWGSGESPVMVTREACAECEQSMGDYGLVIKETEKPQEREEEAGGPGVGPQKPQAGGFLETPSGRGKERGGRHEGCSGESWGDAAGRA